MIPSQCRFRSKNHPFPVLPRHVKTNLYSNSKVTYICVTHKLPIMPHDINLSWQFSQPVEEVWAYLTKPELMELWLMKSDFQPIEGHKFQFTFTPKTDSQYEGIVDGEVLLVKPYTKLSYSWNGHTKANGRAFQSIVIWTLYSISNGTQLQLQHNGFSLLEDMLNHTRGWNSCVSKFDQSINTVLP